MVGTDCVHDVRLLAVLLAEFGAKDSVRQLAFLIAHLANVVQQTRALGRFGIEAEFGSHHRAEVRHLAAVLEQVLSVRRAVFHTTHHADQVGVQSVYAQINGGALADLHDFLLDVLANLVHHFLNAGRVDAAVGDQLVQAQAGHFTADRIKAAQDDGLRGVVHDDLNTGSGFQGADVASLAANDAALDVVVLDVED